MLRKLWQDDAGFVLSAELVLILTIAVLAMIVGLSEVAVAVNTELNDISNAIGNLSQTHRFTGFSANTGKNKSEVRGSTWNDDEDVCDLNTSCDLVCGSSPVDTTEKD